MEQGGICCRGVHPEHGYGLPVTGMGSALWLWGRVPSNQMVTVDAIPDRHQCVIVGIHRKQQVYTHL